MHFKATEPGATAHICTGKTYAGDGQESQPGENTGLKAIEKDGWKLNKKEVLCIYIWIIVTIFAYK
ncbi:MULTISPECIES: hypothetical protein [unclassified Bacteroides]|uniref:hypothetical protein n=1 Tax=unclassified Bacteroides TaxID=2646097 RepID=UPI0002F8F306|nr:MULTISPECIES: hypothetical protein [unclassified Bacteroides]EXY32791.1 hypothetical protein M080_4910 [Bacteroides fragilis str. 3397 T10]